MYTVCFMNTRLFIALLLGYFVTSLLCNFVHVAFWNCEILALYKNIAALFYKLINLRAYCTHRYLHIDT